MSLEKYRQVTFTHRHQHVGISGIVLCAAALAIPPRYPLCFLIPLLQISARTRTSVAAIRGNNLWLIVSVISSLLIVQSVFFVLVDC
jgi:hypothetical protein